VPLQSDGSRPTNSSIKALRRRLAGLKSQQLPRPQTSTTNDYSTSANVDSTQSVPIDHSSTTSAPGSSATATSAQSTVTVIEAIRAASRALRKGLQTLASSKSADSGYVSRNENFLYKKGSWPYLKQFNDIERSRPTFDNDSCNKYCNNILNEQHPNRVFTKPDWMPPPPPPPPPPLTPSLPLSQ